MTTTQPTASATDGCPFFRYDEIHPASSPALEHFDRYDALRESARFHYGVAGEQARPLWIFTRYQDQRQAYQQPDIYSSSAVIPGDPDPQYLWIPEMLDPPLHTKWRQLLGRHFAPGTVERLEPRMRTLFGEILDDVADQGRCDFVQDVALRFPNTIFMELMGLPVGDAALFQKWETAILHTGSVAGEASQQAMGEVIAYFNELIADRRRTPREDLLSDAITWEIDGERVSDPDLLAMCLLLFMAGLDTVASQLSYSILHLATHDDDRRRLNAEPELWPSALEEFLRYYAFVTPSRKVMRDVEYDGCLLRQGEMVHLPLVSANRDPSEFPDADKVQIDRINNRHFAFGAGPHRCLGSHLARQELRIALEEWHKRIPDYRLDPEVPVREHGGQIGLDNVPILWNVGR